MPRPNQVLPEREREICDRVRIFRKQILKWSQPALAKEMGITQNQLSGLEYKRTRLQFGMAKLLCEKFDINQRWLALGEPPIQPKLDVSMEYSVTVKYSSYFSHVFDNLLDYLTGIEREALIKSIGREAYENGKNRQPILIDPARDLYAEGMASYIMNLISLRFRSLPESLRQEYAIALLWAEESFRKKHQGDIQLSIPIGRDPDPALIVPDASKSASGSGMKELLDKSGASSHAGDMPEIKSLSELLDRLKKLTKARGLKADLADSCGVTRQAVDQWFSGSAKPSAEAIFGAFAWIRERAKAKHK